MGYCCGNISGSINLVTSRKVICTEGLAGYTLTIPLTVSSPKITWFFKQNGSSVFVEDNTFEDQQTAIFISPVLEGEYKIIVQNAEGSVIVTGSIPCQAVAVTPEETTEEVKARRVNTKAELITLKNSGTLVNPCIYYVVSEDKHYYADSSTNFADSTTLAESLINRGSFRDDFEAAEIGSLQNGDVYEVNSETNYNVPRGTLKVVRDL